MEGDYLNDPLSGPNSYINPGDKFSQSKFQQKNMEMTSRNTFTRSTYVGSQSTEKMKAAGLLNSNSSQFSINSQSESYQAGGIVQSAQKLDGQTSQQQGYQNLNQSQLNSQIVKQICWEVGNQEQERQVKEKRLKSVRKWNLQRQEIAQKFLNIFTILFQSHLKYVEQANYSLSQMVPVLKKKEIQSQDDSLQSNLSRNLLDQSKSQKEEILVILSGSLKKISEILLNSVQLQNKFQNCIQSSEKKNQDIQNLIFDYQQQVNGKKFSHEDILKVEIKYFAEVKIHINELKQFGIQVNEFVKECEKLSQEIQTIQTQITQNFPEHQNSIFALKPNPINNQLEPNQIALIKKKIKIPENQNDLVLTSKDMDKFINMFNEKRPDLGIYIREIVKGIIQEKQAHLIVTADCNLAYCIGSEYDLFSELYWIYPKRKIQFNHTAANFEITEIRPGFLCFPKKNTITFYPAGTQLEQISKIIKIIV